MSRPVILFDIGAGPLPAPAPAVHIPSAWFPRLQTEIPLHPLAGLVARGIADAVLLTWNASGAPNAEYQIERSAELDGNWTTLATVTEPRYVSPEPDGNSMWYRVRLESFGRLSPWLGPAYGAPIISNLLGRVFDLVIGAASRTLITESGLHFLATEDDAPLLTEGGVPGQVVVDCRYSKFRLALTEDVTSWRFVNVAETHELVIEITQHGAFGIDFPESVVPVSGVPYRPTQTPGAVDVIRLIKFDATTWRLIEGRPETDDDAGGALGVTLSPSPASATTNTNGSDPTAPSVTVTATVVHASGTPTFAWTRTDAAGGVDFIVSGGGTASPSFSVEPGTTALNATQQWRVTVTDALGRVVTAVVPITLRRNVVPMIAVDGIFDVEMTWPGSPVTMTRSTQVVPGFGEAPYTYHTELVSGGFNQRLSGANTQSPTFEIGPSTFMHTTGTYRVTVTDAHSVTHSATFPVEMFIEDHR